jgi:phage/plasmid-associated DNA primase
VATFIYSKKQGSGKNIILDFLQEYVFGNNISYYTTGLETVLEKHNHLLKNKKIVIVDELASSSDNFMGNFDKLKSMMTGTTISINPKGVNQYSIKNVLAWFLISNHDDCIRLEPSDRRYFCLNVSEKYIGNKAYFKTLADTFTQENGNMFFSYIMDRGDNRDVNIRIPPVNAFKKSIISKGWSSSMKYMFHLSECMAEEDDDDEFTVQTAQELYSAYSDFCRTTGERAKSKTKFETDIRDHIVKVRKSSGMCYDLTTITM